jgi:peptide deformylase
VFQGEACLSFPGQFADTLRYKEVYITNNLVEPNEFIATDFLAIACQHEIDHFNETVLFDRQIKKIVKIKQKPNEICLCGKGKKYKKCCGKL